MTKVAEFVARGAKFVPAVVVVVGGDGLEPPTLSV